MFNSNHTSHPSLRRVVGFAISLCLIAILQSSPANAGSLSDPTQPPRGTVSEFEVEAPLDTRTPLVLRAIFFAEGRRVAIINNQRLGIDDVILSARVVQIERGRVSLTREGELIELQLITHNVKKEVSSREIPSTLSELTAAFDPAAQSPQPVHPFSDPPADPSLDRVVPAAAHLDSLAPTREGNEP